MSFTVVEATKKKDVEGQHGPMQVIALKLTGGEAGDGTLAEWFTKASTPLPTPGTSLDGTLEDSQYGKKFKKAQAGSGNFGARPEDPKRAKRILRQHSQDMALRYAMLRHSQGKLPDNFTLEDLLKIADKFDADAEAAAA